MDKRKLRLIPKEPTPQFIKGFASVLPKNHEMYVIKTFMHDDFLILDMYSVMRFRLGQEMHTFRMFHQKDDYITIKYMPDGSTAWRIAALQNLENVIPWDKTYKPLFADAESSEMLEEFLKGFPDPEKRKGEDPEEPVDLILKLIHYQNRIQDVRLAIQHRKITDKIDAVMALVPAIPDDFAEWVEEEALYESRYLVYKSKSRKGPRDAYCTHCKQDVKVDFAKPNFTGICPNCGTFAMMKPQGHSRTIEDHTEATLIQKFEGGLVLRMFSVRKNYRERNLEAFTFRNHLRNPELFIFEEVRIMYMNDGTHSLYEFAPFKTAGARWCYYNGFRSWYSQSLYSENLDNVLKGTILQYSALKQYVEHKPHVKLNLYEYINTFINGPSLEYVVKLGLHNLASDLITRNTDTRDIDIKTNGPLSVMKLSKEVRDRAIRLNAGIVEIRILRTAERLGLKIDDKEIAWIKANASNRIDGIFDVAKETTIYQLIKYLSGQSENEERWRTTLSDFLDYTTMAKKLGWDLSNPFVLFPRDLKQAHDRAMRMYRNIQTKEEDKAIKEAHKRLSKAYGYEDKDYIVKVPTGARELTREGHELHHCVGSYIERVASGRTVIVFLRKKQDPYNPYITMEINPDTLTIVQARGSHNSAPKDEDAAVIERYKQKVLKKTTKKIAV
jgi:predicted RNA-binding Zn-ribbon protein involved in translation (DUF1610 family)